MVYDSSILLSEVCIMLLDIILIIFLYDLLIHNDTTRRTICVTSGIRGSGTSGSEAGPGGRKQTGCGFSYRELRLPTATVTLISEERRWTGKGTTTLATFLDDERGERERRSSRERGGDHNEGESENDVFDIRTEVYPT